MQTAALQAIQRFAARLLDDPGMQLMARVTAATLTKAQDLGQKLKVLLDEAKATANKEPVPEEVAAARRQAAGG